MKRFIVRWIAVAALGGATGAMAAQELTCASGADAASWRVIQRQMSEATLSVASDSIQVDSIIYGSERKLTASDGEAGDSFAFSVAMDGDVAVVGAFQDDDAGTDSGSAYIFERNAGGPNAWGQVRKLTASDAAAADYFGNSVAVAGDVVVIGAYRVADYTGAAYVFERNQGGHNAWGQVCKLTAADGAANRYFGISVAVAGDVALVGSSGDGSAYVFDRNAGGANAWGQVRKLAALDGGGGRAFGLSVAVAEDVALVGAYGDAGFTGAAYVFERNRGGPNAWGPVRKLIASDGAADDRFGVSVAVAGDVALVGAFYDDDAGTNSGSAYVFERDAGGTNTWGQVRKLTASDGAPDDQFGRWVAAAGDVALVGAYHDDDAGTDSGSAYIFERNEGGTNAWGQVRKLTGSDVGSHYNFGRSVAMSGAVAMAGASEAAYVMPVSLETKEYEETGKRTATDAAASDYFGRSVAVAGDVALIGANGDDDKGSLSGSAYVLHRDTGGTNAWGQVRKLTALDGAAGDQFGRSVAVAGDVALVAAYGDEASTGSAYIFDRNAGGTNAWGQARKLTALDGAAGDLFGCSVAMAGDVALVGADQDDDAGLSSGSAYVFERDSRGTNAWGEVRKLTASDGAAGDYFGVSVAVAGDVTLVGAYGDGTNMGSAYVFERNVDGADAWGQVRKLTASDGAMNDDFGRSVAVAGDVALVGAYGDGTNTGSAYIFERNEGGTNAWGQVCKLTAPDGATNDFFGLSVAVAGDVALVGAYGNESASGAAYAFERNAGGTNAWGLVRKFVASDVAVGDYFGASVAVAGDVVLVGAYNDDDAGLSSGSAYVFEQNFPVPQPQIVAVHAEGAGTVVSWASRSPVDYTLQASLDLETGGAWSNVTGGSNLCGREGAMSATNAVQSSPARYYRIKAQNSPLR